MKIKEINRTANVSWSPAKKYPIYLAAATAAQQLDATFSTSSSLELYKLDVTDSSSELILESLINIESRINKLVWSSGDDASNLSDLLIGGADEGKLFIWDPNSILQNKPALKHLLTKHNGSVSSLDVNPFQSNLLASGAGESEIFIWDLLSPENPMSPGSKIQPDTDVTHLGWNCQVQHILASTHAGNCVVWDLRKNDPIIKIRDSMSRIKSKTVCWHPDVATQLCISSEDDHTPVIQLWDLRSATSPLKTFEAHHRGILSMSWCSDDSNLLLSTSKDNRILCWNPNAVDPLHHLVYEMQTGTEWSYDVQWCGRSPTLWSACSFDGHVSVYDIMVPSNKVGDSSTTPERQRPICQAPLRIAPKWMKRPCGASFAFGGKLVTFERAQGGSSEVRLSQVVTEEDLVARAGLLDGAFEESKIEEFCEQKIEQLQNTEKVSELDVWKFLKVNCESNSQQKYLQLLGHDLNNSTAEDVDVLENELQEMCIEEPFKICANQEKESKITECLLVGDFERAVRACLEVDYQAEALMLASVGGPQLLQKTQKFILNKKRSSLHMLIWSIMNGDIESLVSKCVASDWKEALTLILTYSPPQHLVPLCNLLGSKLEESSSAELQSKAQLCYIVAGNASKLVTAWKQAGDMTCKQDLQDLVEKVRILSTTRRGGMAGLTEVTEQLNTYAGLLAEQGCAPSALKYLAADINDQVPLLLLRDRLYNSLGFEQQRYFQKPAPIFNPVKMQAQVNKQPIQQPFNPHQHHHNAYQPNAYAFQPRNPLQQPFNRPYSNGSITSFQSNLSQKTSNPQVYNPTQNYNIYTPQQQQSTFTPNNFQKQQLQQQPPLLQTQHQPPPLQFQHQPPPLQPPTQHQTLHQPPQTQLPPPQQHKQIPQQQPLSTFNSQSSNQPHNNFNFYNPTSYEPSHPAPTDYGQTQMAASYEPPKPATAWNDPPMLTSTKPKKNDPVRKPSYEGLLYNPQDYQQQQPTFNAPLPQVEGLDTNNSSSAPPERRVRQVSERDQNIKDTFDRLSSKCLASTSNPAVRKKIDDVSKKLEGLYDQLADCKLSDSVVAALHQIVGCVVASDYNAALQSHHQLVNSGSFSEISSFGPSVKILIQTALQLNAFI